MKHIILYFFLLISNAFLAQVVNIENRRVNDGTYGFSGALDMTLSAQQQKDLLLTVHFKPLIQYKFNGKSDFNLKQKAVQSDTLEAEVDTVDRPDQNKHMLLLVNDLKYTGAKKTTYANFGMIHLRYAYRIYDSGFKWESYSQIQYNQLLLQKVRSIIGSGLRAKLMDIKPNNEGYDKRAVRLFMGSSLFYEYEEINYSFRANEYMNSVRWSSYLSSYLNFKMFEFSSSTYIQPNIANFKDYRVSGDYSVMMRITKPFSIKLNFSHFFDSKPPETVLKNTFALSVGFIYKLDNFRIDYEKMEARRKAKEDKKLKKDEELLNNL